MAPQSDRADLVDVALGDAPADIAIRGGNLVNVFTREIYPVDILIRDERIAAVLPASNDPLPARWVISAAGRYIAPGLAASPRSSPTLMNSGTSWASPASSWCWKRPGRFR